MYQTVNGTGTMGRQPQCMCGAGTAGWNRPDMSMPGGTGSRNGGQSASEIFGEMPGSMSSQMSGNPQNGMSGYLQGNANGNVPAGMMEHISAPEEGDLRQLDLSIGLPPEAIENPTSLLEARQASLRHLLSKLVGHYVIATFLIGTQSSVSWEGFLHTVGNDFLVIFQPDTGRYVTGDMFSLKFVEFYEEKGVIPPCIGSRRRDAQNIW